LIILEEGIPLRALGLNLSFPLPSLDFSLLNLFGTSSSFCVAALLFSFSLDFFAGVVSFSDSDFCSSFGFLEENFLIDVLDLIKCQSS